MSFENWWCKSIHEAQEKNKKEDEFNKERKRTIQENIDVQAAMYEESSTIDSMDEDLVSPSFHEHPVNILADDYDGGSTIDRMEDDLLRAQNDGWNGVFYNSQDELDSQVGLMLGCHDASLKIIWDALPVEAISEIEDFCSLNHRNQLLERLYPG